MPFSLMEGHESPSQEFLPASSSGEQNSGAPVRVLVLLHKAVRVELEELRRIATNATDSDGDHRKLTVVEIWKRLEFLRSVYAYHCAAEDEVIFLALDSRVGNIACTYSLEHDSIGFTFDSIFSYLSGLSKDPSHKFQELALRIGSLHESICQHMFKEENQVFPLLMRQFSAEEQASLVWQYICSVPVMLMEDLFPWLTCFLSLDEQLDLKCCVKRIVPQDKLLQEVVISWLEKTTQEPPDPGGFVEYEISSNCADIDSLKELQKFSLPETSFHKSCQWELDLQINITCIPSNYLLLWHAAIRTELEEIVDKLYQTRSKKFSNLTSVIIRINFLADVLMFYSNALERVLYPMLEDFAVHQLSSSCQIFPYKNEVEVLQQILGDADHKKMANVNFVSMLCGKMEALFLATCKHMSFLETKVFPVVCKKCNHETQLNLFVRSLRMLPLGLLKCVAIWFSSHLPKNELSSILDILDRSGFLDKAFAFLLHEWICTGYSGKTTTEDPQEMFNSRVSSKSEQVRESKDVCKKSKHVMFRRSVSRSKNFLSTLSKNFQLTERHGMLYSSGVNLLVFSPRASNLVDPFSECQTKTEVFTKYPEARPIDHVYYFLKALKKDLDSLVLDTTKLLESMEGLPDFSQHFYLVGSLYELHRETEDVIAFPALEAKQEAQNLTQSYSIDHKLQTECFNRVSRILEEMSELSQKVSTALFDPIDPTVIKYNQLCFKLQDSCRSLKKVLNDHIHREETELWPLFREYFTIEEQEKIIGYMLGRTRADILQKLIIWLMASLTSEMQHAMMTFWRRTTRYTMFDEWLAEWWDGMNSCSFAEIEHSNSIPSSGEDSQEVISKYLSRTTVHDEGESVNDKYLNLPSENFKASTMIKKVENYDVDNLKNKSSEYTRIFCEREEKHRREEKLIDSVNESNQFSMLSHIVKDENKLLVMSQAEQEAAIRRVSQDSSLNLEEKSRAIQNLMTSCGSRCCCWSWCCGWGRCCCRSWWRCLCRWWSSCSHWVAAQALLDKENVISSEPGKFPGQCPSYRETGGTVFGCKHYKQNCKLLAACCNRLFTCRRCHDEVADHVMDRKATTQMMCMKCLEVQPIGPTCLTPSCANYPMARYYCKICRLFDDDREIYHCPYCNICRVGKGLGIDYFHCMKCNACMSRSLSVHMCREKCFEDKCPICHEDIFTSSIPIKALTCGHLMHSTCFQDYTLVHYTCPVCSKSLGNMQVYFEMLDALLAEENMPDEFRDQIQAILCNDCEKKGTAPYHWLYHKCQFCGSYNSRVL